METYEIDHILLPTDFSDVAENALQTAIAISKRQKATLTLLHVVEQGYLLATPESGGMALDMLRPLEASAKGRLNEITTSIRAEHEIDVKFIVVVGHPAFEICRWAAEQKIALIVMGTHGASGLREFFIGSNAYSVVKHSPCPIMTIPGNNRWIDFRKILFPVRMVPEALSKYDFILPIIRLNASSLQIAGIVEKDDPLASAEVKDLVEVMRLKVTEDNIICSGEVHYCDNVAKHVLHLSEAEKPDLVVITATLEKYSKHFFVGPYSQYIVNHAKFPVLSIRPEIGIESPALSKFEEIEASRNR